MKSCVFVKIHPDVVKIKSLPLTVICSAHRPCFYVFGHKRRWLWCVRFVPSSDLVPTHLWVDLGGVSFFPGRFGVSRLLSVFPGQDISEVKHSHMFDLHWIILDIHHVGWFFFFIRYLLLSRISSHWDEGAQGTRMWLRSAQSQRKWFRAGEVVSLSSRCWLRAQDGGSGLKTVVPGWRR